MTTTDESAESGTQWDGTDIQNLVRHRKSGKFYGRFRVHGKRKFVSLKTNKKTIAKLRLFEESAKIEKSRHVVGATLKMSDIYHVWRQRNQGDVDASEGTKTAREDHMKRIEKTWPELADKDPATIKLAEIFEWSRRARSAIFTVHNAKKPKRYSPASINKSVDVLKRLFRIAVEKEACPSSPFESEHPDKDRLKATVIRKKLCLPEAAITEAIFTAVETPPRLPSQSGLAKQIQADARDAGELVRFMAYSGARLKEAGRAEWEDCRDAGIFIRGTKSESSRSRLVPWNRALHSLIEKIRARRMEQGALCSGVIHRVRDAEKSLTRACKEVGAPRFTHHTLRHYFATVVIESGVEIPILAEWLGHSDGGVLAMSTYGHLRSARSIEAGARVSFGGLG
jgi:integrase